MPSYILKKKKRLKLTRVPFLYEKYEKNVEEIEEKIGQGGGRSLRNRAKA